MTLQGSLAPWSFKQRLQALQGEGAPSGDPKLNKAWFRASVSGVSEGLGGFGGFRASVSGVSEGLGGFGGFRASVSGVSEGLGGFGGV